MGNLGSIPRYGPGDVNDDFGHAMVMEMYDIAIKALRDRKKLTF